jgi:predicted methyltransferase
LIDQTTHFAASGLLSRRLWLAGAGALALSACGRKAKPAGDNATAAAGPASDRGTIEWAVAGDWRLAADRKRDAQRHPVETLHFFGLQAGMTVVEVWPGAGWYTDIIAPFLNATHGKLYAANLETPNPDDHAADQVVAAYEKAINDKPDLYGHVEFTTFGPHSGPMAPAGTADLVLFFNLNNWMAAGIAEKAFRDAFAALRGGGVLGIEQARASSGGAQDPLAASGYVQTDYVKQLAAEAGFRFDAASEINANPKDTRDHPFGAATLPPIRRSSPLGKAPNPLFDHKKYDAIGEPDRMTLRFVKP